MFKLVSFISVKQKNVGLTKKQSNIVSSLKKKRKSKMIMKAIKSNHNVMAEKCQSRRLLN